METVWDGEVGLVLWSQALGGWLEPPMRAVTVLGGKTLLLPLLALLFWCVHAGTGARLSLVLLGSSLVNGLFKGVSHGPRPYWFTPAVTPLTTESTFGLPSGHAQTAVAVWGYLAARIRRRWAWPAAAALIALIAFSRVYLGAHFVTDVVAGMAVGALLLWLVLRYEDSLLRWWRGRTPTHQVGLAFTVSLLPGVGVITWQELIRRDWRLPAEWTGAVPPDVANETLTYVSTLGGGFFGVLVGFSVLAARGWYSAEGPLVSRAARYVIGMAGTVLILVAVRTAVPTVDGAAGALREYAVYALMSLWGALGAPELFLRMRLAVRPETVEGRQFSA
ncbi:phosphatase PAP2 family protein [Allosalinactinospora lopnorensis]|uniref:phosphatase PAP2 family protein n=1 Tax=Allosalinactinospora lopnorensis TaxID=1352348 RepID=UPI000623BC44|nr:phosphatase PAP2 family protein [Allosalinactinospora lopnorensis]